jgi:thioredoxin-like negative regulator of GroEL
MRRLAVCACGLLLTGCASTPGERLPPAVEPEVLIARAAPPADVADHLARAAACVDRGDEPAAVPHLVAHLNARPDAVMIRAYLAELFLRTGKPVNARHEFERFARQASGMYGEAGRHLVHAHTRLMEIAADANDAFAEHLHRGIALVLMVRRWESEPQADDGQLAEATLVKAGRELRQAERRKPTDPRANVYLAEVYGRLGQLTAARTAARRVTLPDVSLTESERESLRMWGGDELTPTRPW